MTYLLICACKAPILGIYDENLQLVHREDFSAALSEALPAAYAVLRRKYPPRRLVYTHTPGSFMALKIAYCFFATAAIASGAELYGISAFAFAPAICANRASAFLPGGKLVLLSELKLSHPEYFDANGQFCCTPQLGDSAVRLVEQFIPNAEPEYCISAY